MSERRRCSNCGELVPSYYLVGDRCAECAEWASRADRAQRQQRREPTAVPVVVRPPVKLDDDRRFSRG